MNRTLATLALATGLVPLSLAQDEPIRIDGTLADWTPGATALATSRYVYLRFALPQVQSLQSGPWITRLEIDVDSRDFSGRAVKAGDVALGVDFEVVFNPPPPPGSDAKGAKAPRDGIELRAIGEQGIYERVSHATVDLSFAPSSAAKEYELRFARTVKLKEPVGSRWKQSKHLRGRFVVEDTAGATLAASTVFELDLPPAAELARAELALPAKSAGSLRALSWNVEWEGPVKDPEPFARVLAAIAPDLLLLQEWKTSEADLAAWFSAHVPSPQPWRVHTFPDLGVSIVSRLPLVPLTRERLMPDGEVEGKRNSPIRFVGARVDAPWGPLICGSLHLKCCGGLDSIEDRQRQLQAQTIQKFLARAEAEVKDATVLVTGDFNLVGSHEPVDLIREMLDADGSALEIVDAYVAGGDANYTWRDARSHFSPGRLDYALYSDAALEVEHGLVFDADRWSDASLQTIGVQHGDAGASDHRPLIVDLRRRASKSSSAAPAPVKRTGAELRALATDGTAKATIVNLWASWCAPCVKELPDFLRLERELRAKGVRLILITCDFENEGDKAVAALTKLGVDFGTYQKIGTDEEFIDGLDAEWSGTLPSTILFDAAGKKVRLVEGPLSYEELAASVEPLLAR